MIFDLGQKIQTSSMKVHTFINCNIQLVKYKETFGLNFALTIVKILSIEIDLLLIEVCQSSLQRQLEELHETDLISYKKSFF